MCAQKKSGRCVSNSYTQFYLNLSEGTVRLIEI